MAQYFKTASKSNIVFRNSSMPVPKLIDIPVYFARLAGFFPQNSQGWP